ncbi:hypothetical protein HDU91_004648 [Kappamyces sp. JEL0680]|nr:hypothetical protein HDU91_004648 [Kappamyces sp. JEL0680]
MLIDVELAMRHSGKTLPGQPDMDWDRKILQLLESPVVKYDLENALFLAQQYHFDKGLLVLYEKLSMFEEYLEKSKDFKSVLDICRKYGDKHPDLWVKGFVFCARQKSGDHDEDEELVQILQEISRRNLMSDVEIIDMLAKCELSLGNVRSYLLARMQGTLSAIEKSQKSIATYEKECTQLEHDIKELETRPITFQATKCELCKQSLDLPSIHFLCKHSFHAKYAPAANGRCLGDMTNECPKCGPERHLLESLLKTQVSNGQKHEAFVEKVCDVA